MTQQYSVNIVGASGYVGADLVRLVAGHPHFVLKNVFAYNKAGERLSDVFSNFEAQFPETVFLSTDDAPIDDCDIVFLALPHTQSQQAVLNLTNDNVMVVDLSADFRFEDADIFETWYLTPHLNRDKQSAFVYGLPEVHKERLAGARYIAAPGCYPTAAILASKPFIDAGLHSADHIIVDAASGVSGAGAKASDATIFSQIDSNFSAYGLVNHRHTPEMKKELGVEVLFTPHLAPMVRGILATCYIPCDVPQTHESLNEIYTKHYDGHPFLYVSDKAPSTKSVMGTNNCAVSAFYDERTHHIIAISAIDNLVKGSGGQAIQAANIALGLDETAGLSSIALFP